MIGANDASIFSAISTAACSLFFHMKGLKPPSLDGDFDFNSLTYARLRGAWFDDFQSSAPKCANPPTSVGGS